MKAWLKIVGVIVIAALCVCCSNDVEQKSELIDFIPENTSQVLKINDLEILRKDLKQNEALSQFKSAQLYQLISGDYGLLHLVKSKGPGLLCLNRQGDSLLDYTYITGYHSGIFQIDSLKDRTSESLKYGAVNVNRVTIDKEVVFTSTKDSIFMLSSSQLLLENILSGKHEHRSDFKRSVEISKGKELMLVRSNGSLRTHDSLLTKVASQITLDITIAPGGITAAGIAMARDSASGLINVFRGQLAQKNTIAAILPTDAVSAVSFTFNNASELMGNLREFRADTVQPNPTNLFETITELSEIYFMEGKAIVMGSIDGAATEEALTAFVSEHSRFRDVDIQTFSGSGLFINRFSPLVSSARPGFTFRLDQFFVFTESISLAEKIIAAYQSNDVVKNTGYFKNAMQQLGDASSLLIIHMNHGVSNGLTNVLFSETSSKNSNASMKKYPLSVMQFSYDRDFAHVNYTCLEASTNRQVTGRISQLAVKSLDRNILGEPQFFSNHRTGGLDIVLQDFNNRLHLLASNGKSLWTKQLNGPILGEIHEVDILRNGKKQLAFTTANKFYILDRNGKDVGPFPISFKDPITQPLSVFDYDSNRKYRFAIIQGKEVFLYDSNGKIVSGFKFKKTTSRIVQPARHFRFSNKDYIVIPEENGTLHILSRVGTPRVPVSKKFEFSEIPITTEGSNFVVITSGHTKESISQKGKVTSTALSVSDSYWFTTDAKIKVTLDDNLMRIDGKLVELPFGIYTNPKIYRINRKTYIAITETQEKNVYIYDASGSLLTGFPIFGTSTAILGDCNKNGKLDLLVKGSENEIILYQLE